MGMDHGLLDVDDGKPLCEKKLSHPGNDADLVLSDNRDDVRVFLRRL